MAMKETVWFDCWGKLYEPQSKQGKFDRDRREMELISMSTEPEMRQETIYTITKPQQKQHKTEEADEFPSPRLPGEQIYGREGIGYNQDEVEHQNLLR